MSIADDAGAPEVLKQTASCCPVCLEKLDARLVRRGKTVFLEKTCPDHGDFSTPVWRGEPSLKDWTKEPPKPLPPVPHKTQTTVERGCPRDCGICPEHRERVCCVLLEVTRRCNQECPYCFAEAGAANPAPDPDLDEIIRRLAFLRETGEERPYNLHISGGEPTVREDLPEIIAAASTAGFPYLQLNTNGLRLAEEPGYAETLKEAGVSVVFLQFDGTDDRVYRHIRGRALAAIKTAAVEACCRAGLPVVPAVTLVPGINTGDLGSIIRYALARRPFVRGVHFQPVSYFGRFPAGGGAEHITIPEVLRALEDQTGGMVRASDFTPPGTAHPACSFHGSFTSGDDGALSPAGGACGCREAYLAGRDYVASRWVLPGGGTCCSGLAGWDDYLDSLRRSTFTITGMAFQDAWNLDLDRLSRCKVFVLAPEDRLVPFCAWNLTSTDGQSLHRGTEERKR